MHLLESLFPLLLGISSTQTSYNHVVVIWNGIVIDYESKFTFPVTEESIRRICGVNTTFRRVSTGFGLFPPKQVRKQLNDVQLTDWGITEFYKRDGNTIRGYFLLTKYLLWNLNIKHFSVKLLK